ncbi:MAG: PilZ domain-containing protein [Pyrinomonadaceae bacterium]
MPQVVNTLEEKMRSLLVERRRFARQRFKCEVRLPLGVSLPNERIDPESDEYPQPIMGHTRDLSLSGLSLVVPSTRLGAEDISRRGAPLRLVLCLPGGIIIVHAETVHCEPAATDGTQSEFLIGARIRRMFDADRRAYENYLRAR